MGASSATAVGAPNGNATRRRHAERPDKDLAAAEPTVAGKPKQPRSSAQQKYRHVAAVHSQSRPSCLSHDSHATPSFIGFRNLMVIVLGELGLPPPALRE